MQLVPTALLAALLAATTQAEVQFNYITDVPYSRALAIVTANNQLQLLKDEFKKDKNVNPKLSEAVKTFQASVEDGTFTWPAYMDEYDAFVKSLKIDDQKAVSAALAQIETYTPWDRTKEYVEYSWDCITRAIEEAHKFYVEQDIMTDEIEEKINAFQSPILRIEPAQYLAGDRVSNFLNDMQMASFNFALEVQSVSTSHIREMETNRKEFEDPWVTTESSASNATEPTETTEPTTTTAAPVANNETEPQPANTTAPTPSETKSAASLASISMAIATVAVSVAAIFA